MGRIIGCSNDACWRSLLDEIVRDGARQVLAAALNAEVAAYIDARADEVYDGGHRLVVGNGSRHQREALNDKPRPRYR